MIDPPAPDGVVASLHELIALRDCVYSAAALRVAKAAPRPGSHASMHHSRGMEFAEARAYQAGDDVRSIDWRQTARHGKVYTKLFREERERPVRLLVDLGPSMRFGTRSAFKSVVAARAAALLAWTVVAAGDRVGGAVWNGAMLHTVAPQGRHRGALALLRCLATASALAPAGETRHLASALRSLAQTAQAGSLVVLISDFVALNAAAEQEIAVLAARCGVLLLHVYDPFEAQAPPPGRYRISDGQRSLLLDLRSGEARAAYGAAFAARRALLGRLAQRARAPLIALATHDAPHTLLQRVFSEMPAWRLSPARLAS